MRSLNVNLFCCIIGMFMVFFIVPDIFQEAGLPLWLRPYEVLVTSSYTALIETIPDTVSYCICLFHVSCIMIYISNIYTVIGFLVGITSFYKK